MCAHLLCGGGDDALLQSVRLLLEIFPRFMIPVQIILYLVGKRCYSSYNMYFKTDTVTNEYALSAKHPRFSLGWPSEPGRRR